MTGLCIVLDDYQAVAAECADWRSLAPEIGVRFLHEALADRDAAAEALRDASVVVAMRERTLFPDELLARLPNLRLLVTTGMRNDAIDLAAAARLGILVSGTGGSRRGTPELTWALILGAARNLTSEIEAFRSGGRWHSGLGVELGGKTLGVVGLGTVGAAVAKIGRAFEMRVVAWSSNLTAERCTEVGVEQASSLRALLADSDVVTLHLKLGDRSRGLIGLAELEAMKPGSILVNTARGPIVEEDALLRALRGGPLGALGVDVYDREPLPDEHPFRHLPNVFATPHLGYVTRDAYAVFYREAVENIRSWLDGRPCRLLASGRAA